MKLKLPYLIGLLIIISGCARDKIDFDLLDDIRLNPQVQIPLLNAKLGLGDMVQEDSTLTIDPDNGLRIVFRDDSLFGFTALEFVTIPAQDPTSLPLIKGQPAFDLDLGLGTLGDVELESAVFSKGYLRYILYSDSVISSNADVRLTIKNATIGGNAFSHLVSLPAMQDSIVDSVDVSGLTFDFSNGGTDVNFLGLKLELESADSASVGHVYNFGLNFVNLSIDNATGFFGRRQVNIPGGDFNFDVSSLEDFIDGFFLANPIIKLVTSTSVGMGIEINPDFDGVNGSGDIVPLNADPLVINAATSTTQMDTSILEISKQNSDIVSFLAALPRQILYAGNGIMNPNGNTGTPNFISKDSKVNIGLIIDLPLEIRAENMRLEQTINDVSLSADQEADIVEELALFFNVANGFPFDVDVNVSFLDSITGDSINGVAIPLLNASPVDAQGRVIQKVETNYSVVFDQSQIDALLRSDKMNIKARINTSNNGQQVVKLFTDYDLDIKLATKVKVNYQLKQNDQ